MPKILIIEDDPILLKMYQDKFQKKGFALVTALNGRSGLIQAKQEQPDLILLDLMMPYPNGLLVLQNLKDNPQTATIPVAILTVAPKELAISNSPDRSLIDNAVAYWRKDETKPSQIVEEVEKYFQNLPK